ncbi:hypothetical protein [Kocuria massiliensis]|uniref:hypothetical protein n=1 Tax=Kocuria massiliensis TaxID=1926282 RepID=UPI0022B95F3C|nr:hypothetical protein [Kocuria massiliensis]
MNNSMEQRSDDPTANFSEADLDGNRRHFGEALRRAGWLVPAPGGGPEGLGDAPESVVEGLNRLVRRTAGDVEAEAPQRVRFPGINAFELLQRTDYVASFPQLLGAIATFDGETGDHRRLLRRLEAGEDWADELTRRDYAMVSAACHPLYRALEGTDQDRRVYELVGDCFRDEPSPDPMRRESFRMHEIVTFGDERHCLDFRGRWLEAAHQVLTGLGLQVEIAAANDPFFGRAGKMLASGQRAAELKFEILTEVYPGHQTAIASANYHQGHFGEAFTIAAGSDAAHTACAGFGLERIALSLAAQHGTDTRRWPEHVRDSLGLV